ncbi:helix-turn-helix domain-containing protein [Pontimicrobium sp. MEBiC06410]
MIYSAYRSKDDYNLVEEYFELSFNEAIVPFATTIIPIAFPLITLIKKGSLKKVGDVSKKCNDIIVSGQCLHAYDFAIDEATKIVGIVLHPTALYKLTNQNLSAITNKHVALKTLSEELENVLLPLLQSNRNKKIALEAFQSALKDLTRTTTKHTKNIDYAIKYIRKKEGLLNVSDLLDIIPVSQKTLETKFKEIVGVTPGKYIKLYRFLKLMRKYASKPIKFKDLIFMYDYYDESHFLKEFKLFMKESPKEYFKKDNTFMKEYLKE